MRLNIKEDYSISLIQGDYCSFVYNFLNCDGSTFRNVKDVVFTCKSLHTQKSLTNVNGLTWSLTFESDETMLFTEYVHKYDITIIFSDGASPITMVHNANMIILKKENTLYDAIV